MVDRQTRCILSWQLVWERTQENLQDLVDEAPKARSYTSDGLDLYALLWYHFGRYEVSPGKTETYSVEAGNAELRHYLARLARSSRCFSRCPYALACAIRWFVFCFNHRQLKQRSFPNYAFHLLDFVYLPL